MRICLAASNDVHIPEEESSAFAKLVGYTLIEATAGAVGPIVAVQPGPAQDWLVVESADGEVLVPAVDAFLGATDHDAQTIHATLPDGLLDLAQGTHDVADSADVSDGMQGE